MIDNIITYLNARFAANLPYMADNMFGLCRKAQKTDGNTKKTYPAVINEQLENCNTDKEVYVMPDRKFMARVWWEQIGNSSNSEVSSRLETMIVPVRMYIWLNAEKINQQQLKLGNYLSDIFALIPKQIPQQDTVIYRTFVQNIRFKQNSDDFRIFSFDPHISTRPYIAFTVDMEFLLYVNRDCIPLLEVKNYDQCGGEIS